MQGLILMRPVPYEQLDFLLKYKVGQGLGGLWGQVLGRPSLEGSKQKQGAPWFPHSPVRPCTS